VRRVGCGSQRRAGAPACVGRGKAATGHPHKGMGGRVYQRETAVLCADGGQVRPDRRSSQAAAIVQRAEIDTHRGRGRRQGRPLRRSTKALEQDPQALVGSACGGGERLAEQRGCRCRPRPGAQDLLGEGEPSQLPGSGGIAGGRL
jgi:hypothetical protein